MNPALLIFTQIAIAGSGFLIYFLYALWRDSRKHARDSRVNIRRVMSRENGNLVVICSSEESRSAKVRSTASR
jgi:threonine/homoserine/homoserine lactone efflux protein